jgi:hypothetical protein
MSLISALVSKRPPFLLPRLRRSGHVQTLDERGDVLYEARTEADLGIECQLTTRSPLKSPDENRKHIVARRTF